VVYDLAVSHPTAVVPTAVPHSPPPPPPPPPPTIPRPSRRPAPRAMPIMEIRRPLACTECPTEVRGRVLGVWFCFLGARACGGEGGRGGRGRGGGTWVLSTWREARSVILCSLYLCSLIVKCVSSPVCTTYSGDHLQPTVYALCLTCPCDPPYLLHFHFVRVSVFGSCPAFRVSLSVACGGPCGRRRCGREGVKRQIVLNMGSRYEKFTGRRAVFYFPVRPLSP